MADLKEKYGESAVILPLAESNDDRTQKTWEPDEDEMERKKWFENTMDTILIPYRGEFEPQWQDAADIHEQLVDSDDGDERTNVVLPLSTMLIETKLSEELENRPDMYFEAMEKDDVPQVKILEEVIKRHVWEICYMDELMFEWFYEKNLFGQSWLFIGYAQTTRKVLVPKKEDKESGQTAYDTEERVVKDDIFVKLYRNDQVWVEPCRRLEDAGYCVLMDEYYSLDGFLEEYGDENFYKNLEYVQEGAKYFYSDGKIEVIGDPSAKETKCQINVLSLYHKQKGEFVQWANGVEIYYGAYPYDDGELPLVQAINRYRPGSMYHKGETELCAGLFALFNAIFNTTIDAFKYSVSPVTILPPGSSLNMDQIILRPGLVVKANAGQIQTLKLGQVPGEAIQLRETILDMISWSTGVNIRQMLGEPATTTATVAALRKESLAKRINLGLRLNESRAFKRMGELFVSRVQQFYTQPKLEEVLGEDSELLEDLEGEENNETMEGEEEATTTTPAEPKYKQIKVPGMEFEEEESKDEETGETNYKLKATKGSKSSVGFFPARPEYIRTKSKVDVKVRPGSTVAVSQLLEQQRVEKVIGLLMTIPPQPTGKKNPDGTPEMKPIADLKYFVKKLLHTMKYDEDRAMNSEEDEETSEEIMRKHGIDPTAIDQTMTPPQQTPPQLPPPAPGQSAGGTQVGAGMTPTAASGVADLVPNLKEMIS